MSFWQPQTDFLFARLTDLCRALLALAMRAGAFWCSSVRRANGAKTWSGPNRGQIEVWVAMGGAKS